MTYVYKYLNPEAMGTIVNDMSVRELSIAYSEVVKILNYNYI
jgi:hypothetical protein